jgi:hypothetical protein
MKIVAGTALVTLFLALPATAFAMGMETVGNAPAVKQPDWADGVVDVVNLKSRVYSQWVNGNENFFYRGNAQALNEALRKYAAVKDDVRQLILLPGAGKAQSFDRKVVEFDWELHVPSGIYKAVAKRTHAVMTVYVNATKPRARLERKMIEKWLGDLNSDRFQTREKASQELQKLGHDAKPFLREALKTRPAPEVRRRIEGLLEKVRDFDVGDLEIPKGITVISVDDLLAVHLKGLKDTDSTVCGMAIQDLSGLASYSDKVVPALTGMLEKDKKEWVRRVAAACLASIGVKARSAVPVLKQGLGDPDANIRNAFKTAIDQIKDAKDTRGQDDEVKRKLMVLKEINAFKEKLPRTRSGSRGRGPR